MTVIEIGNLALLKFGHSRRIAALDEDTEEMEILTAVYDHALRMTLRVFPMPFSTKYADLELVRGPAWDDDDISVQEWDAEATYVEGDIVEHDGTLYYCMAESTNNEPPDTDFWSSDEADAPLYAEQDWKYAYRWPEDCLFARRLVDVSVGRKFSDKPIPYRVGRDVNGLLIYSNEQAPNLEYTTIDCDALYPDDIWISAFSWMLAFHMCPSLTKDDKRTQMCFAGFKATLQLAGYVASNEQQQEKDGDASWISARN